MFATIRVYAGNTELIDALVEHESDVKRLITEIDGFKSYYLLRTADGGAASVSIYETQAGASASDGAARRWIAENLPDLNVAPPQVSAGDVVINF
jgi:heme-degrading monooxygenase HmoA